ncbi:hypothetical protein GCM10007962_24430 [Yeosuana aromativorans]|uniref:VWA domain-containing protein n=1 Tax=Yeosuana aromativorans TaxID=288019 RepID=A0A8J3FID8_9FLAO|nr:VWA domain-containing protein [Yeosuana aromativorans]GGK29338.1 hypothetical protein GCM10007962_24430 [Yeosuana aromativorans]
MTALTILYIVIAGIIALFLALFLYKYKSKATGPLSFLYVFLRFVAIFSILLLIINPKFESISFYKEKPNLILAIDNSSSIKHLKQDTNVLRFLDSIKNNKALNDKFNIETYQFGNTLKSTDTIDFSDSETNMDDLFGELPQIYNNDIAPMLLITDGNQTFGNDYQYTALNYKHPIYPIILGDTVTYTDVSIKRLNVNRYAFLKNKFPVECFVAYNGNGTVNSRFEVYSGNNVVFSKPVRLSKNNNSEIINFTLPADYVGVHSYKASIVPIANEKNIVNNTRFFAVEVIDQKTNVAIVSDFPHPDLGALKKSIESNEQRSASILNTKDYLSQKNDFQLVILYQPNAKFKQVFESLNSEKSNWFMVVGKDTDLNFLNSNESYFSEEITNQTEDVQAELNTGYSPFIVDDINFGAFPPLKSNFGDVTFTIPYETLLYKRLSSNSTTKPLLATFEVNNRREAVLFGEGIWQWRAQSFLNTQSFSGFDTFLGKLIQYLSNNKRKNRLDVDYKSFYNGNNGITIRAEFFDKNYNFDDREELTITVKDSISEKSQTFPFILKNNSYQVDLSSLPASDYSFEVRATHENISQFGKFKILEYNVEQQFLNANVTKLQQVATNSNGTAYFIGNTKSLTDNLLKDNRYMAIQKKNKRTIPLIDWKYLLFIIAISLSAEWFLRKYNGLI